MAIEADHIISLGGNCRITHHLRRFFGFDTAYPFDWWATSLTTITTLLHDPRLDLIFDPGRLELVIRGGRPATVRNTFYDIYFRHEFAAVGEEVAPGFRGGAAAALERQRNLFHRFSGLNAAGKRLLFVRSFVAQDEHVNRREVDDFIAAVREKFHEARVTLVFINPIKGGDYGPEIPVLRFLESAGSGWRGDAAQWDKHLATLGVKYAGARATGLGEAGILPPTLPLAAAAE